MREHHVQATALQTQHEQMARNDHTMLASVNHGRPAVAATARPGMFKGEGVVAARGNVNSNRPTPNSNVHTDRPPNSRVDNIHSHSTDRPQTAVHQPSGQTSTNHADVNRPRTEQLNNQHPNNIHPNTQHSPQQPHENRPPEHEPHQGGQSGHGR